FSAVDILSRTLASLPLTVYWRLQGGGKERAIDHPLYSILHDLPNPEMTSFELRQALMGHLALWGNAFAEIERDNAGRVVALWPLRPDRMTVKRDQQGLLYVYRIGTTEEEVALRQRNVMHIRGLSSDGIIGYSPIRMAREAIGLALATEEFGARFFGNGSRPGGVLQHPGKLSDEAARRLKKSWEEMHQGLTQAHRVAILEEGMTWQQVGIPPEDAQFLETRKFQVTEIARIFHIPPHMLADLERSTFSNIEHQGIEFVVHTMRPWLVCWEQAIKRDLFLPSERNIYFAEFLVDGLLRGDIKSRYEAYAVGRQNGWLSADDIRELENMNPLPDGQGKVYLVPLNMVPASMVGTQEQARMLMAQQQEKRLLPLLDEERARRAAGTRRQAAKRYERLFREREERIVKREAGEIKKALEKYLGRRDVTQFQQWLEDFYREHKEYMQRTWWPLYLTYADEIQAHAAEEINAPAGMTRELEDFILAYLVSHIALHANSSLGQLRQLLEESLATSQDPGPVIEQRLDEWIEKRPDKIAKAETVQAANAVAREVYKANGIQRVRWVSFNPSCPYCSHLDGRVVGIESSFIPAGVDFQPEGAEKPLKTTVDVRHPPGHQGCDCQIMASA
ncbi:phage portal protein, partial [Marinobacter sp.]|uniref:phage portal protein n=1 Tax=Marinobacter sp. TaxID=50741 RepID=UPI0019BD05F0